jgi:hypothetical protein
MPFVQNVFQWVVAVAIVAVCQCFFADIEVLKVEEIEKCIVDVVEVVVAGLVGVVGLAPDIADFEDFVLVFPLVPFAFFFLEGVFLLRSCADNLSNNPCKKSVFVHLAEKEFECFRRTCRKLHQTWVLEALVGCIRQDRPD